MMIGFVVVAALLMVVVVTSTRAYLTRRALVSFADGAAVTAAQEVSEDVVYREGLAAGVPLDSSGAAAAVRSYVARNGLGARFDGFSVADVSVTRAGAVRVVLHAVSPVAFLDSVTSAYAGGVPITVDATAEAVVG
jgi:uncharacterized membrane protein